MKPFLRRLWKLIKAPFTWMRTNLTDKATFIIFVIVALVLSVEVWGCYLIGIIFSLPELLAVASVCWLFWLGPGTPFLPLCLAITIGLKALLNKLKRRKKPNGK